MTHFNVASPDSLPQSFDVLVVGAGAAGLYSALCLPEHYRVGLINKDTLPLSASDWAQGGIAAAISSDDSPRFHLEDTLKAGAGLCEPEAVEFLVEHAPDCIRRLVELGVAFDRKGDQLALTLEAAHSHNRVLHAADTTGRAVVATLMEQIFKRPNIQLIAPAFALDLWMDEAHQQCLGISLIYNGYLHWIRAGAVVLATGGGGQVFAQTTNPEVSTGDGVAIAWRAGALLRDLEFFQFHPTALTKVGAPRFLISEAVRGEGAHLIDYQGMRFAFDYHPSGELAPRDVVSRAIFNHLQQLRSVPDAYGENVWLDLRPIDPDKIRYRFPNIIQVCQKWGVNVFQEPIPVAPAAHYWMGGIVANPSNQTSIRGLYAVGETASTGVHGANRLASNSLLECIVFGAQMGSLECRMDSEESGIQRQAVRTISNVFNSPANSSEGDQRNRMTVDWEIQSASIQRIRAELPQVVWQSAGICRQQETLEAALAQVEIWSEEFSQLPLSQVLQNLKPGQSWQFDLRELNHEYLRTWGETYNLLNIGTLILKSAAFRHESRGGHYRQDYPYSDPNWQVHTLIQSYQIWKSIPVLSP